MKQLLTALTASLTVVALILAPGCSDDKTDESTPDDLPATNAVSPVIEATVLQGTWTGTSGSAQIESELKLKGVPQNSDALQLMEGTLRWGEDVRWVAAQCVDGQVDLFIHGGDEWAMTLAGSTMTGGAVKPDGKTYALSFTKTSDDVPTYNVDKHSAMCLVPAGTYTMGVARDETNISELNWPGLSYGENFASGCIYVSEWVPHQVHVSGFIAGKYELTLQKTAEVLEWANTRGLIRVEVEDRIVRVYNAEGSEKLLTLAKETETSAYWSTVRFKYSDGKFGVFDSHALEPLSSVTWYGALAICNYLSRMEGLNPCIDFSTWGCDMGKNGYRLPTEAEWERVARSGFDGKPYPWGSRTTRYGDEMDAVASGLYDGNHDIDITMARFYFYSVHPTDNADEHSTYVREPLAVGSLDGSQNLYVPWLDMTLSGDDMISGYGMYDVSGNVAEWCWDWYREKWYQNENATVSNTMGPSSGSARVTRGGGWEDFEDELFVYSRNRLEPDGMRYANRWTGLRLVRRPSLLQE